MRTLHYEKKKRPEHYRSLKKYLVRRKQWARSLQAFQSGRKCKAAISSCATHLNGLRRDCSYCKSSPYNKSSGKNIYGDDGAWLTSDEHFSLSNKNIIVAIGYEVYAYAKELDTSSGDNIVSGCASFCGSITNNVSSSSASSSYCTGNNGCCQSEFSKTPRQFSMFIQTMNTEKTSWASSNCTYFFVAEKGISESNFTQLLGKCKEEDYYEGRMAADWVIGNVSCDKAMRRPKYYACRKNSRCVDDTTRPAGGYQCDCSSGYQGNPYLPHGCQGAWKSRENWRSTSLRYLAAITFVVLVAVCLWLRKWLRKREEKKAKQKFFKRNGGLLLRQRIPFHGESGSGSLSKLFLKEELEKATNNFNEIQILGKGGLGTVYKGMLSDGSIVAVKKSNAVDEDQIEPFINEILTLPNKSDTLSSNNIMMENRLRIAAEIAGALSYMHSCASTHILHSDIKSNILLDDNFRGVVFDFGISRFLSVDKTHLTTLVGGTFGYIDPEYFQSGQLTEKCDVYAFGVILAELLTSQRAVTSNIPEDPGLVIRFTMSLKQNCIFEIVDPEIVKEVEDEHVILAVAKLAKRCLNFNARKRPCMKEVAAELDRLGKMRQDMPHAKRLQDNVSP
ncbi:hypothetical protein RND71_005546 [Anisodus tanguticus]|uniref:Protein kinase domain-containing protein n=1 Tax=Anisodus tanguticus TaxID=243964 RepID=A0AAE1SS49_9SOLA|nr:hypothetical protein RND71_005546 [Anisodus tanguticus]